MMNICSIDLDTVVGTVVTFLLRNYFYIQEYLFIYILIYVRVFQVQLYSIRAMSQVRKLKFRTFSSKDKQGFIIYTIGPEIPLIILQDILFQLFEPLFPNIMCPEIYFFSSTDEILNIEDISNIQDFIYVHFLQRVEKYKRQATVESKIRLGLLELLSQGIGIKGTNLYIFSQKQYMMYGKDIFLINTLKSIEQITEKHNRKSILYNQYIKELQFLKDNIEMVSLNNEIMEKVQDYSEKVQRLQVVHSRYVKAKSTLFNILQSSGIVMKTLDDLN